MSGIHQAARKLTQHIPTETSAVEVTARQQRVYAARVKISSIDTINPLTATARAVLPRRLAVEAAMRQTG